MRSTSPASSVTSLVRRGQSLDELASYDDGREGLACDVVDVAGDPFPLGDGGEMGDSAVLGSGHDRAMVLCHIMEDSGSNDPDHDHRDEYEDPKRPRDRAQEEAGKCEDGDHRQSESERLLSG